MSHVAIFRNKKQHTQVCDIIPTQIDRAIALGQLLLNLPLTVAESLDRFCWSISYLDFKDRLWIMMITTTMMMMPEKIVKDWWCLIDAWGISCGQAEEVQAEVCILYPPGNWHIPFPTKACLVVDDFSFPQSGICCFWRVYSSLYLSQLSFLFWWSCRDDHEVIGVIYGCFRKQWHPQIIH